MASYASRSSTAAASVVTVPATPITAPASAGSTEQPSSASSMSATAAAISLPRRRVAREVALVEPHRADVQRLGRDDAAVGVAEDQLGRATADVDNQEGFGQRRQVAGRSREAHPRLLVTVEDLGHDTGAFADAGEELLGVLGVPGRRGRAEPDALHVVREFADLFSAFAAEGSESSRRCITMISRARFVSNSWPATRLVWVNPIEGGRDRSVLDSMLREVACPAFSSAHIPTSFCN